MRFRFLFVAAAVLGFVVAAGGIPATAATSHRLGTARYRLNPPHNIRPPRAVYGRACSRRPHGRRCTRIMVHALDTARGVLHQPGYRLPKHFASLRSRDQLLVLSDLDRRLYGRTPIRGLNPQLERSARAGARQMRDPRFVMRVNGASVRAGGSNWAGGTAPMNSALFAYYEWMYDDGPGAANLDCKHKGDPGCWGHRDNILLRLRRGSQVEIGVGFAKPRRWYSWTELLEAFPARATIPCLPSVTGLSAHAGPSRGRILVVHGFGFVRVRKVTVLGRTARITKRSTTALTIKAPAHAPAAGFVQVTTASGASGRTAAAAYRYTA